MVHMDRRFLSDEDLARFVTKYFALRREGLTNSIICQRFGLSCAAIYRRLGLWREKQGKASRVEGVSYGGQV